MSLKHRLGIHQVAMGHSCTEFIHSQGLLICRICGRLPSRPQHKLVNKPQAQPVLMRRLRCGGEFEGRLVCSNQD